MTDADITADLHERLTHRYSAPEWFLATEATVGGRRADGIAINLWRSRGWVTHGFEVKASRSDWLRELKNPEKADHIAHVVDAWWVVAPRGVVLDGELPAGWGLLERSGRGLRAKTSPRMPKDLGGMDRELAARLVARVIADEEAAH